MSVAREQLAAFRDAIHAAADQALGADAPATPFDIDATVTLPEVLDPAVHAWLERLEPFGRGHAEPMLRVERVYIANTRAVGERHVAGELRADGITLPFIGFNIAESYPPEWLMGNYWAVIGHLGRDPRGALQFRVVDLRAVDRRTSSAAISAASAA